MLLQALHHNPLADHTDTKLAHGPLQVGSHSHRCALVVWYRSQISAVSFLVFQTQSTACLLFWWLIAFTWHLMSISYLLLARIKTKRGLSPEDFLATSKTPLQPLPFSHVLFKGIDMNWAIRSQCKGMLFCNCSGSMTKRHITKQWLCVSSQPRLLLRHCLRFIPESEPGKTFWPGGTYHVTHTSRVWITGH